MKKILLLFFALMLVPSLKAQDVIVMNDGTIIEANIKEIRQDQYVYEKWNGDGTIYVIDKDMCFSLKFDENKASKLFSMSNKSTIPSTSFSYERLVTRERRLNVWRNICQIFGGVSMGLGALDLAIFWPHASDNKSAVIAGGSIFVEGFIILCVGNSLHNKRDKTRLEMQRIQSLGFATSEYQIGDIRITPTINLISDNATNDKTTGIGLTINF